MSGFVAAAEEAIPSPTAPLTETCDDDSPRLIIHIETTTGPVADGSVVGCIHDMLKEKDLLLSTHFVDMGYVDAELLANGQQEYGIDLCGPARGDIHEQARAGEGFDAQQFRIDWDARQATCPAGCHSISWTPAVDNRDNDVIKLKFARGDCRVGAQQATCTTSTPPRWTLTIRPRDQYLALQAVRERQLTAEFKEEYATRSGIEGALSQGIRGFEMRRARYVGQAKTHLQNVLTATAMNLVRARMWLAETPRANAAVSVCAAAPDGCVA
jgi:transposase